MRSHILCMAALAGVALACDSCEHPERDVVLTRHVRRMQPDAQSAALEPRAPLAWGQLNVIHTTDTHGWLEGHLKEKNYGADWGDFVSFVKDMRRNAETYDVDLLVVDTGVRIARASSAWSCLVLMVIAQDLHDGAGLSDATSPNGVLSNPIFESIGYDLLTIGNHELYLSDIAYETFRNFSSHYGERYLTSNVQIYNPSSSQYEYIGKTHRYFTTKKGLRIMSFGLLFDFTGNSNVSKVIPATQVVNQTWFKNALHTKEPIDLFLLIGHNPVRPTSSTSTFKTIFNAIRAIHPDIPIQIFGGHTHVRDFAVYDDKTTALESGRYCETLGWLSMSGFKSSGYRGCLNPPGVPHPTMKATKVGPSASASAAPLASSKSSSSLRYSRRYLDWNRLTMEYHAKTSRVREFDVAKGVSITKNITATRHELNLTSLFGCAPQTWCISCAPFGSNNSIYTVLAQALSTVVKNESRAEIPRVIVLNTGSVRFDLVKGPFTYDDSFIVSPFTDAFQYIANVPYSAAVQVLPTLNAGAYEKRSLSSRDLGFYNPGLPELDDCVDTPSSAGAGLPKRTIGRVVRRQAVSPGYTTTDDFGTDGDDTIHTKIPYYSVPNDFQATGSFPANGSLPSTVDMVFLDFIADDVIDALNSAGQSYSTADVSYYLPETFTTNSYLPAYAKIAPDWQKNVPNCPVGLGVGYNDTAAS
nr:secreted protein [Quercus suber]